MASAEQTPRRSALLLLPALSSISFSCLKDAYGSGISILLSELSQTVRGSSYPAVLDVAIATSCGLRAPESQPRSRSFARLQQLLAAFYRLLGVLAASGSVELDGPGGVDARVFFVDRDDDDVQFSEHADNSQFLGPIVGLGQVATSHRSWEAIYSIDSEDGDGLLQRFVQAQGQRPQSAFTASIRKLPAGVVRGSRETAVRLVDQPPPQASPHHSAAVGGTFDHLHTGHKLLLTATVLAVDPPPSRQASERTTVTIGITGDELLVNKKYAEALESWEERWQGVWEFLRSVVDFTPPGLGDIEIERVSNPGPNGKYVVVTIPPALDFRFVQISDPFGPTITDRNITALVVSKETHSGGQAVNDERQKKGWPLLNVFEVDILDLADDDSTAAGNKVSSESFEAKISSTEIRRKRMNLTKGSL